MKMIAVVALAFVAVAVAVPVGPVENNKVPQITTYENEQKPDGGYRFKFESEDGINKEEEGDLKEVLDEDNKPQTVVVVRGSYSYINVDGQPETITYYADETGFHAEGLSIPQAPPQGDKLSYSM